MVSELQGPKARCNVRSMQESARIWLREKLEVAKTHHCRTCVAIRRAQCDDPRDDGDNDFISTTSKADNGDDDNDDADDNADNDDNDDADDEDRDGSGRTTLTTTVAARPGRFAR
jgi:hypothetical protein